MQLSPNLLTHGVPHREHATSSLQRPTVNGVLQSNSDPKNGTESDGALCVENTKFLSIKTGDA